MTAAQQQPQGVQVSVQDLLAILGEKEVTIISQRSQIGALAARNAELEKKLEKPAAKK